MKTVCERNKCCGCYACSDICPVSAITLADEIDHFDAIINTENCIECGACEKVCPQVNILEKKDPILWHQGWSTDEKIRKGSSSGGVATAIISEFLKSGGKVATCEFSEGSFNFVLFGAEKNLKLISGSKYVKSNPKGIYKKMKTCLLNKEKVLFIGLPCQVAALKRFIDERLQERLYTIDLICHGTPSIRVFEMFARNYDIDINTVHNFKFRKKSVFQIYKDDTSIFQQGAQDPYIISFLDGISYTENCYECKYACTDRVSDLTIGDSWGSKLDFQEVKKGISLMICQTEKGKELISYENIYITDVDIDNAIFNNLQLRKPSPVHLGRDIFFSELKKNHDIRKALLKAAPKRFCKQSVKSMLIKYRFLK